MSVNKVVLVGRLGADPEKRVSSNDTVITKFRIATDRRGRDQGQTDWHSITTFGRTAELCAQYLSKGRQVYIEGRISYNKSQKNDQWYTDIIANDVQFLSGDRPGGGEGSNYSSAPPPNGRASSHNDDIDDDIDIPF